MSETDNLIAFVTARLDEDEAIAQSADPGPWEVGPNSARKGMVYVREEGDLLDSVGLTWREPVFVSQVPNKRRFRENAAHIARHDPARVLREIGAKRAVLAWYADSVDASALFKEKLGTGTHMAAAAESYLNVIRGYATAWSDHPDYLQEWVP